MKLFLIIFCQKGKKIPRQWPHILPFSCSQQVFLTQYITPQISSIKISLTRGLIINFLLKFHVHYYGCMHGITQQTMASQLVQNTHNKNMSHLWLDMLDMSTTILTNWNQKNCHIAPPPPKSSQKTNPCPHPPKSYCPHSTKEEMLAP